MTLGCVFFHLCYVANVLKQLALAIVVFDAGCSYPLDDFSIDDATTKDGPGQDGASREADVLDDVLAADSSISEDTRSQDAIAPLESAVVRDTAPDESAIADSDGGFEDSACTGKLTRCGADCVDLKKDPAHCGDCSTKCDVAGGEKCNGGMCH